MSEEKLTPKEAAEKLAAWVKTRMPRREVKRLATILDAPVVDWVLFRERVVEALERKMKKMEKA